MPEKTIAFIYKDAQGKISYRSINNISKTIDYIQGVCYQENGLRTFRKDRVLEYLNENSDINERLQYHINSNPPPIEKDRSLIKNYHNPQGKLEICFTGFKQSDKEKLIALAEKNNFFIRPTVTKNLHFLCCGYNAGPSKIEKSRHQGVMILSEAQFMILVDTGEISENF